MQSLDFRGQHLLSGEGCDHRAAATNIFYYHRIVAANLSSWDEAVVPPLPARASALISVLCWCSVVVCGRLIALRNVDFETARGWWSPIKLTATISLAVWLAVGVGGRAIGFY